MSAAKIECASCGASLDLRYAEKAHDIACNYCGSVTDVAEKSVVAKFAAEARRRPVLPPGVRLLLEGIEYEVTGFLVREGKSGESDEEDDDEEDTGDEEDEYTGSSEEDYSDEAELWEEYLLFNPFHGYRFLTTWQGHWNFSRVQNSVAVYNGAAVSARLYQPSASMPALGRTFKYSYSYHSRTLWVEGEFPWRIRENDSESVAEFVKDEYILAVEEPADGSGITYSLSKYTEPSEILNGLKAARNDAEMQKIVQEISLPEKSGLPSNAPNPYRSRFRLSSLLVSVFCAVMLGLSIHSCATAENKEIFSGTFEVGAGNMEVKSQDGQQFAEFTLEAGDLEITGNEPKNLEVDIATDISNSWTSLNFFVMNEEQRQGFRFDEDLEYYYGGSGEDAWSEGSSSASFTTQKLPPGKYFALVVGQSEAGRPLNITLRVRRDAPIIWPAFVAIIAAVAFWFVHLFQYKAFESSRG